MFRRARIRLTAYVADPIGFDELRIDAEPLPVPLVLGQAREAEQRVGDVAGTLRRQEVAVMDAAVGSTNSIHRRPNRSNASISSGSIS